ncbi:glycosyltransferase family 4 protein [Candidatus Peregrinibacteria bacterium]|jgi:O-antigen biosynthesis protein|nr:glycosyltransferase family 4 protein [Candidatus Peregrinibacteria bacterium]
MKRKHILVNTHNLNLEGAPIFLFNLAKGFLDDFDVTMVSPKDGPLRERVEEAGIKVEIIDFLDSKNVSQVKSIMKTCETSLVLFNTLILHNYISELSKGSAKFVWIIHESEVDLLLKNLQFKGESFEKCDKVVFAANATKSLYMEYSKDADHFHVIPNGVDLSSIEKFKNENSKEQMRKKYKHSMKDFIFLDLGTLCWRKGQMDVVETFASLFLGGKLSKNTYLYLVGDTKENNYAPEVVGFVKQHNLEKNIRIIPAVPHIYDFYRLADVFVFTSYIESFPLVTLDVMAFELPILSTKVYGLNEQFRDEKEALVLTPNVYDEMKDGMLRLMGDTDLRQKLSANAFSRVNEKFELSSMYERYKDLFKTINV